MPMTKEERRRAICQIILDIPNYATDEALMNSNVYKNASPEEKKGLLKSVRIGQKIFEEEVALLPPESECIDSDDEELPSPTGGQ